MQDLWYLHPKKTSMYTVYIHIHHSTWLFAKYPIQPEDVRNMSFLYFNTFKSNYLVSIYEREAQVITYGFILGIL